MRVGGRGYRRKNNNINQQYNYLTLWTHSALWPLNARIDRDGSTLTGALSNQFVESRRATRRQRHPSTQLPCAEKPPPLRPPHHY